MSTPEDGIQNRNNVRINGLVEQINTFMDYGDSDIEVELDVGDIEPVFMRNGLTSDQYLEQILDGCILSQDSENSESELDDLAVRMALRRNRAEIDQTQAAIGFLVNKVFDRYVQSKFDIPLDQLGFTSAVFECRKSNVPNRGSVTVMRTRLNDLDQFGSAEYVLVEENDNNVVRHLSIVRIGTSQPTIQVGTEANDKGMADKITAMFSDDLLEVIMPLINGQYDDEEDLDAVLDEILHISIERCDSSEVVPLLDLIRAYALDNKSSRELERELGYNQPNEDEIRAFQELIAYLS